MPHKKPRAFALPKFLRASTAVSTPPRAAELQATRLIRAAATQLPPTHWAWNIVGVTLTVTSVPAPKETKTTVSTTAAPSTLKPLASSARQVFTGSLAAVLAMAMAAFA
ncbi:unnamed protein product [Polarella glacialis]|uniref:Uncharacterized protein n=1 Tax=Polarella glacialis TaxID=89957 RepID=A0A813FEP2_POLGL|nr:unnamed protein product [Polarella glacialis]